MSGSMSPISRSRRVPASAIACPQNCPKIKMDPQTHPKKTKDPWGAFRSFFIGGAHDAHQPPVPTQHAPAGGAHSTPDAMPWGTASPAALAAAPLYYGYP